MNCTRISAASVPLPVWRNTLDAYAVKVMDALGYNNWVLSVLLCDNKTIKELNSQYRNINEATDVLSFQLGVDESGREGSVYHLPGDVIISLDALHENAVYFNVSEDEELRRLLIHGILHLSGYDHKTNDIGEPMLEMQERILKNLHDEHILGGT